MSRKRTLIPDVYRTRKRVCAAQKKETTNLQWEEADYNKAPVPTDTKAALLYLRNLFPADKFEMQLPPILVKHQLYSIVKNRTQADREMGELRSQGEVRLFKLGSDANDYCVVLTEDYREHVQKHTASLPDNKGVLVKFLDSVIMHCQDVSLSKQTMMNHFHFEDDDITQLVNAGVLTVRDVGSWWLAIPQAGTFMKSYLRGRKAIMTTIRKCRYREILQQQLESRKLPKAAKLGMAYHIHDIIGADLVNCIQTTSGQLLRLKDS